MAPTRTRHGPSGLYPLWLGLGAAALFGGLWVAGAAPVAAPAVLADLGVLPEDDTAPSEVEARGEAAPPHGLVWHISKRSAPTAAELGACLRRRLPEQQPLVLGNAPHWTLTFGALPLPQSLKMDAEGVLALRTPVVGDRRGVTLAHVATAACLNAPDARLHDPELNRDLLQDLGGWPEPGPAGGAPVEAFISVVDGGPDLWHTAGLARLGRAELGVASAPGAEGAEGARRVLILAASVLLASDQLPPLLVLPGLPALTVRPVSGVAEWPTLPAPVAGLSALVQADGQLYRAPPASRTPRNRTAERAPASAVPAVAPSAAASEPARPRVPHSAETPRRSPRSAAPSRPASGPRRSPKPARTPATKPAYLPDYL